MLLYVQSANNALSRVVRCLAIKTTYGSVDPVRSPNAPNCSYRQPDWERVCSVKLVLPHSGRYTNYVVLNRNARVRPTCVHECCQIPQRRIVPGPVK